MMTLENTQVVRNLPTMLAIASFPEFSVHVKYK